MPDRSLLLIRHSSQMRRIAEAEIVETLSSEDQRLVRRSIEVDTEPFAADADGGGWTRADAYLRSQAEEIRREAIDMGGAELRYYGLAEIPHIISLGAFIGDEIHVISIDYNRDVGQFIWPESDQTITVETTGVPQERVTQNGAAVIRVSITAPITDGSVEAITGNDVLADVQISPRDRVPERGIVRSVEDVQVVRLAFRNALAQLEARRPNLKAIHLFVAAPPAVCFVLGQELNLRNRAPIQTYRFRTEDGQGFYRPAVRLTAQPRGTVRVLDEADIQRAAKLRTTLWVDCLEELRNFAEQKREDAEKSGKQNIPWYDTLKVGDRLSTVAPFPGLPPLWRLIHERDSVSLEPFHSSDPYAMDKQDARRYWRLSDDLIIGFDQALGGDADATKELIRLFFVHEYLHDYHDLTKYTAEGIGRFANSLERIDYSSDLYAILHNLDFAIHTQRSKVRTDEAKVEYLERQIDHVIRSFWAFETGDWQERRVRRYLNWYWRQVQVRRSTDLTKPLDVALQLLSKPPSVELSGVEYVLERPRIYLDLGRRQSGVELALGLVTEDDRMLRLPNSSSTDVDALLSALKAKDHRIIKTFFNSVFEAAKQQGGAHPRLLPLSAKNP